MKKQILALSLAAMLFGSCSDEVADWKVRAKNLGRMNRTFKVDSTQSEGEAVIRASESPLLDDDYYRFGGNPNTGEGLGKAVRYQGEKLYWQTLPQVIRFNWDIRENGDPYSADMGGNDVTFGVGESYLIISVRPIAPGQRWQRIWAHPVSDGVGMNGIMP